MSSEYSRLDEHLRVARSSDGQIIRASDLAEIKEQRCARPDCTCLSCGHVLVACIGSIVRPYFRHKAGEHEGCWASVPEGPAHIEAKERLLKLLTAACRDGVEVVLSGHCRTCWSPRLTRVLRLAPTDSVLVEVWGDPSKTIKPDVQVVDAAGKPRLYLEVFASSGLTAKKEEFVRASGIPLLEVHAEVIQPKPIEGVWTPIVKTVLNKGEPEACSGCAGLRVDKETAQQKVKKDAPAKRQPEFRRPSRQEIEEEQKPQQTLTAALRLKAEANVRQRLSQGSVELLLQWCHVAFFSDERCVSSTRVDVWVSWADATSNPCLELRSHDAAGPIGQWIDTPARLERLLSEEVRAEAGTYIRTLRDKTRLYWGHNLEIETFGGAFSRTKDGRATYLKAPPPHERIYETGNKRWVTAYPCVNYPRTERLDQLCAEKGLERLRGASGPCFPAKVVHECFKRNSPPRVVRPKPEDLPSFRKEVDNELQRLEASQVPFQRTFSLF